MRILSGKVAFEMKATHGIPLDMVFHELITERKVMVDWVGFIEAARANGWWDFQTYEAVEYGLNDASIDSNITRHILQRFKLYILSHPHPKTVE